MVQLNLNEKYFSINLIGKIYILTQPLIFFSFYFKKISTDSRVVWDLSCQYYEIVIVIKM